MTKCEVQLPAQYPWLKTTIAPEWAQKIVAKECKLKSVALLWNPQGGRRARYVSGVAQYGRYEVKWGEVVARYGYSILVNAGKATCERNQLYVLLHEVAHHNVGLHRGHDAEFMKEAIRLYRKHRILEEVLAGGWSPYPTERKAIEKALKRSAARASA